MPREIYLVKVGMTMTEGMVSEWFIADGEVVFSYVYARNEIFRAAAVMPKGAQSVGLQFRSTGENSASLTMMANEREVAKLDLPRMWPIYAPNSGLRCGENQHAPISREYEPPFKMGAALRRIVVDVDI